MAKPDLLEICDLAVEFPTPRGTVHAVNGVSFRIREGEIVGVVGETGCGKSVTARSIIGLTPLPGRITKGTIQFSGYDLRQVGPGDWGRIRGPGIGFVPQNPWGALNPVLRIEKQFENVLHIHGTRPGRDSKEAAHQMLKMVGIADPGRVLRGYAHELSGGIAQRIVIALATILHPRLLIADEPTSSLDLTIQRQILDLLADLARRESLAMLLVTHDLGVVAQYCERVLVMYAGKIVESGPVSEVMKFPAHPYTKALLAAIPRPGRPIVSLRGTVVDLVDYPRGCPFRARCDFAFSRCIGEEPKLVAVGDVSEAACHLVGEMSNGAPDSGQ